jgi:hypothetical protein
VLVSSGFDDPFASAAWVPVALKPTGVVNCLVDQGAAMDCLKHTSKHNATRLINDGFSTPGWGLRYKSQRQHMTNRTESNEVN